MTASVYQFEIDWGNDGYQHPYSVIPQEHVGDYVVEWGGNLQPGAAGMGVRVQHDGTLRLMDVADPGGRYWAPTGVGALTEVQLQSPHSWRLRIDGVVERSGRATPVLGQPLGTQIQYKTWLLAGSIQRALASSGSIEPTYVGTASALYSLITERSGITVVGPTGLPISGQVSFRGSWAALINQVATLVGAWPVDTGGAVRLATPGGAVDATLTQAHRIGLRRSGVGLAEGLVRTRWFWPGLAAGGVQHIPTANESTYGRSIVNIPADWFSIFDIPQVVSRLQRWAIPPEYVQLDLVDRGTEAERTAIRAAVPGATIRATVPQPGGAVARTVSVVSVTLTGGSGQEPHRMVRGLSGVGPIGSVATNVPPANAPPRPFLRLVPLGMLATPSSVEVTWDSGFGAVDVVRSAATSDPALAGWVVVSAANDTGSHTDTPPGDGWWLYGLRLPGTTTGGYPNQIYVGPGGLSVPRTDPVPQVTSAGDQITVQWATELGEVDVGQVQLDASPARSVIASEHNSAGSHTFTASPGTYQLRLRQPSGPAGTWHDWAAPVTVGATLSESGTMAWAGETGFRNGVSVPSWWWHKEEPGEAYSFEEGMYMRLARHEARARIDAFGRWHILLDYDFGDGSSNRDVHVVVETTTGTTLIDANFTGAENMNFVEAFGAGGWFGFPTGNNRTYPVGSGSEPAPTGSTYNEAGMIAAATAQSDLRYSLTITTPG